MLWLFRWLIEHLDKRFAEVQSTLKHLENKMSAIEDAVARNEQSTAALLTAIQTEITQLAEAVAAGNGGDDDALAARLNALSDEIDTAKGNLDADDPAAPPAE